MATITRSCVFLPIPDFIPEPTMKKTFALVLLMVALPAFAHPGHDSNPLQDGLLHPLTGLDHLLMLLGTGVLAALTGRSLTLPLATLAAMFGGAVCGHLFGDVVGMEQMILGSLLVAAAAMLVPSRQLLLSLIMPVFALFHGWAHGVEATPSAFWQFSAGFVTVSGLLLAAGFGVGCLLRRHAALQKAFGGGLLVGAALVLAG
jgi:urease accessory protein